ncbi:hypothetical protein Poly59_44920 [Rubripirellula reticaptiva]|uniref:Uncharacterized protein n=1 Tax=Rubripirellula reticaptiva TaxID=2528013 RepID=A0A5C6EPC5_9BACT|nr:hypothetical protein Poly59_44920 [Rubripirellula reticaptiva]
MSSSYLLLLLLASLALPQPTFANDAAIATLN